MRDVLWRGYEAADAPALAELMNTRERHAGGNVAYTADELQGLISTLVGDVARDSTMVLRREGELVAAGFTTTPPEGGFRVFLTGGVHPRWRGRGLGREVLGRHLARGDGDLRRAGTGRGGGWRRGCRWATRRPSGCTGGSG